MLVDPMQSYHTKITLIFRENGNQSKTLYFKLLWLFMVIEF